MATLEIAKKKRISPLEEALMWTSTVLVAAGGFYGVLQMWNQPEAVRGGERVIEKTRINISKEFGLPEPEEIEEAPIICIPVRPQDCA